ncbi:MAG: hypothetical protein HFE63_11340 [Clostridiales bacterium]|nr:hypothetical protein [Clostridiales bacterium]
MTSASSSTEAKRAKFMPFFGITLKQRLTTMLLILIIFFFALPIPLMMAASQGVFYEGAERIKYLREMAEDWSVGIRFVIVPLTSILSVVMSCAMLRYLKNRVSVDFYHSLPIKRSRLYVNQLLVGYIVVIVPLIFMLIASLIVCACNSMLTALVIQRILRGLIDCIVYSLVFYGLSTVVGMVSGVTGVHLVLTGVAIFILPLIYIAVIYFVGIFNENMWMGWYISRDVMCILSPVMRFCLNLTSLRAWEIAIYLIVAAGMFVGGYFIYAHRKSERAGVSVVFTPLGSVIKYVLVFLMTLFGGLFFYLMMENFVWTVFGMVCGGLLTFMLANTILQKSAKLMFRGLKGFAVYCVVIALSMLMLLNNVFGVNSSIPEAENLSKVIFNIPRDIDGFEFKDIETMAALRELYVDGDWSIGDINSTNERRYYYANSRNSLELEIVFCPKFGLPQAKQVTIYNVNKMINQLHIILDSDEFKQQYVDTINNSQISYLSLSEPIMYKYDLDESTADSRWNGHSSVYENRERLYTALKSDIDADKIGFDYFQRISFGYAEIRNSDGIYNFASQNSFIPIYSDMENLFSTIQEMRFVDESIDEKLDEIIRVVEKVTITEFSTGKSVEFTSLEDKREIFMNVVSIDSYSGRYSPMTLVDSDYYIDFSLDIRNDYADEDEYHLETYSEEYSSYFLYGRVPNIVLRAFE